MLYDTVIIGGGPAGVSAGIYAARKKLSTVFIADQIGGQSIVSADIENWIGEENISGAALAMKLEKHLRAQEDIEIKVPERASAIVKNDDGTFTITTDKDSYMSKTVILCIGGRHRTLDVPGEAEFNGKGVAYCATCDAPFFRDKEVAVVGGGNSGLEAVLDLIPYAKKVSLLVRKDVLRGDQVTQEQVLASDKVEIIYNANTTEIMGETMVTGLRYDDLVSKESKELAVQGVFVEIGSVPNSEMVKDIAELTDYGEIVIDHRTQATSVPGLFAAGDVTTAAYKQNNIAAGDAITALLSVQEYVRKF